MNRAVATALTPDQKERQRKARARVYRIREGMRSYIHSLGYIAEAWAEGDWKTLGYSSWELYLAKEFGADQVKLPPEQRLKALRELRLEDMPNRALAAAMNVDEKTTRRDRAAAANAAVIDGEIVPSPAKSPIVEAMTGAIEDADARNETAGLAGPAPAEEEERRLRASSGTAAEGADIPPSAAPLYDPDADPYAGDALEDSSHVDGFSGEETEATGNASAPSQVQRPSSPAVTGEPTEDAPLLNPPSGDGVQGGPVPSPAGPSCEKCGTDIGDDGYRRCADCDPDGMHTADDGDGCRLCALLATVPDEYLPIEVGEGVHGLQLQCRCGAVVSHLKAGMPLGIALVEARLHHGTCQ